MDLNQYIKIYSELNLAIQGREDFIKNISATTENIKSLKDGLLAYEKNLREDKETNIAKEMENKSIAIRNSFENDIRVIQNQIGQKEKELIEISPDSFKDFYKEYLDATQGISTTVDIQNKEMKVLYKIVTEYGSFTKNQIKSMDIDELLDLCLTLESRSQIVLRDLKRNQKLNSISDRLIKFGMLSKYLDSHNRALFLLAFYATLTLVLIKHLAIFSIIYISFIGVSIIQESKQMKSNIKLLEQLGMAPEVADALSTRVHNRMNKDCERQLKKNKKAFEKFQKPLLKHISELREEQELSLSKLSSMKLTPEEIDSMLQEKLQAKKDQVDKSVGILSTQLKALQVSLANSEVKIKELSEKQKQGKQELEDTYFNPTRVSESKILPNRLLMAFEDDKAITLDMEDYTLNVICRDKDDGDFANNKAFITMCIMQLVSSINPSCIDINIIDLKNATNDFGIYQSIPDVFHVITLEDEMNKTIDALYDIKIKRDADIKSKFDSINDLNEYIIENYGITEKYYVLIIANANQSLYGNKKFINLMESGDIGFVTINMIPKNVLRFAKLNNEEFDTIQNFFSKVTSLYYFGPSGIQEYLLDQLKGRIQEAIHERKHKDLERGQLNV